LAPALLDSGFFLRLSGVNTEFDFFGPSQSDDSVPALDAKERDAVRWEGRVAGSNVASNLQCIQGPVTQLVPGPYPIYDAGTATAGQALPVGLVVTAVGVVPEFKWGQPTSSFVTGITVKLARETSPVPGETELGNADARILDPNEPDVYGNPGRVTVAFGTTTSSTLYGNGNVPFGLVPGLGLNIFSAIAWELSGAGDGSGAQAKPCGFAQPQKIYFKIRGTP
jgi:hypothetical protein